MQKQSSLKIRSLRALVIGTLVLFQACSTPTSSTSSTSATSSGGTASVSLAAWAQTLTSGSGGTQFNGVSIDPSGNTYAVGYMGTGTNGFGNSVTATGTSNSNSVIVKYNSAGQAQWAQTLSSGSGTAHFNGVASDTNGNTYAVGYIYGTGTFGFGNSVTATGTSALGNPVIVKYNKTGVAQWAQTLSLGVSDSSFQGVAIDTSGNAYAVGSLWGTGTYGFGSSVTATGASTSDNTLIVKYNSAGQAQWAQTLTLGLYTSVFCSVTVDTSGNAYAVGTLIGTGTYGFGNSVSAKGVSCESNSVIVKYNSAGQAQWAQTLTSGGNNEVQFNGVTMDTSGNIYAVGYLGGTDTYGFGNSVTATGTAGGNTLIVKYNSSGVAQWAQTLTSGSSCAQFTGVNIDSSGNAYAVGCITGTGTYDFGNSVTAKGSSTNSNTVIVKYNSSGAAQWVQTMNSGSGSAIFQGVTIDASGNTYAVGYMGTGTYGFGNSVTATGLSTSNSVIVKYSAY